MIDEDTTYLTRANQLRLEALRLATVNGGDPDQVVGRAEAYYAFLRGDKAD